jgi:hypothetical protein
MSFDLEGEKRRLEARISELELKMNPIQNELRELRERLSHVIALMPTERGESIQSTSDKLPKGYWARLCREHNLHIGGDSAHRVIARKAPQLHKTIHHWCDIDGRAYPHISKTE